MGTWESGTPLTITSGTGQSPTGVGTLRADRIGNQGLTNPGHTRLQRAAMWFNIANYAVPPFVNPTVPNPANQFGTAGIGTVIGPRFSEYDMTMMKDFQVWERLRVQFRADAFDIFNIPMLGTPTTSASSTTFGQILTANSTSAQSGPQTGYTPRTIQLGLRLNF
jgi:hypothetical protein